MLVGLCASCAHHRVITNRRGSRFHMCQRGLSDPRFAKYPPLPVLRCSGFEPVEMESPDGNAADRDAEEGPGG